MNDAMKAQNIARALRIFAARFKAPYTSAIDAAEAERIFDGLPPDEKDATGGKTAYLEAFAKYAAGRDAFVKDVLARLEKGEGLDPQSKDPSAEWRPCGKADAVFYLAEVAKEIQTPNTVRLYRHVIEPGYEADAFCYLKPASEEWQARMQRRQEGIYRGIHVDKFGEILCPPELAREAQRLERRVEWYFAVDVPDASLDAGMNPRNFRRFWRWFQVEDFVWAGLFIP